MRNLANPMTLKSFSRSVGRFFSVVALSCVLFVGSVQPSQSRILCSVSLTTDYIMSTATSVFDIYFLTTTIGAAFSALQGALLLQANQLSNDVQNETEFHYVATDNVVAHQAGNEIAGARAASAMSFIPSRVTCSSATSMRNLMNSESRTTEVRDSMNDNFAKFNANAGGGAENGRLGALSERYTSRCGLYANAAAMKNSNCAGATDPEFVDLDIKPFNAIFDQSTITDPKRLQAAYDAVAMLTDIEGNDPTRGPAFDRLSGRVRAVETARQQARVGFARGILTEMVASRAGGTDGSSRSSNLYQMVTGKKLDATGDLTQVMSPAETAGEGPNAAVATLNGKMASQAHLINEISSMLDQLAGVSAAQLAISVEKDQAAAPGVSARPLSN